MFKYPVVDTTETELKAFAQIATPRNAIVKDTTKKEVIKKVQFSRTVEVFKISPVKVSEIFDSTDTNFSEERESYSDDSDGNDDGSFDCPSPVIPGKSPSLSQKTDTLRNETGYGKAKMRLFSQTDDGEKEVLVKASDADSCSHVGVEDGFMMFSQLTLLFEESFEAQVEDILPHGCDNSVKKETDVANDCYAVHDDQSERESSNGEQYSSYREVKLAGNETVGLPEGISLVAEEIVEKTHDESFEVENKSSTVDLIPFCQQKLFDQNVRKDKSSVEEETKLVNVQKLSNVNFIGKPQQEFLGFRTAAGKTVSYSKEAEEKSRKLLLDLNESEAQLTGVLPSMETLKQDFVGFRTAAGKTVSYSKEAEEKSRKLLLDLNESEAQLTGVLPSMETPKQDFVGFRTAAGKTVSYSTEAEEKSRKLLLDLNESEAQLTGVLPSMETPKQDFVGFRTAAGKTVSYSKEAEEKSRKLLLDLNESEAQLTGVLPSMETPKQNFVGFRTAAGKTVSYSKEAEEKSWKLLLDLNKSEAQLTGVLPSMETPKQDLVGFRTAAGKTVSYSKEAEKKSRKLLLDLNESEAQLTGVLPSMETPKQNFVGFRTAAGKTVSYSKEAEDKSRKLLLDLNKSEAQLTGVLPSMETPKQDFLGFRTAAGKTASYSKEAEKKSRKLLLDLNESEAQLTGVLPSMETPKQDFVGFRTAAGKTVSYSKEAEEKSRKLLLDINEDQSGNCIVPENKNEKLLNDPDNLKYFQRTGCVKKHPWEGFPGFQTGKGKLVSFSDKSLNKSRKLQDIMNEDFPEDSSGCAFDKNEQKTPVYVTENNRYNTNLKMPQNSNRAHQSELVITNCEISSTSTDDVLDTIVRAKQKETSIEKAVSDSTNYRAPSNPSKTYQLRSHSRSGKSFQQPRCLFEIHDEESIITSKGNSTIGQIDDSKYTVEDSASVCISSSSKSGFKKRNSCKFKSPVMANKLVYGNHRKIDTKSKANSYSAPAIPANKLGRISTLRSLCSAKLSLEDLAVINDHRASIHLKFSSRKVYMFAMEAAVSHYEHYSFKVEEFFSPRALSTGVVHIGDNAQMNIRGKQLIGYLDFHSALLAIPG